MSEKTDTDFRRMSTKFSKKAKLPLPRYPKMSPYHKLPIIRNVSKPHIFFHPKYGKWVCGNYFAVHRATSIVFAYRGFKRAVSSNMALERMR